MSHSLISERQAEQTTNTKTWLQRALIKLQILLFEMTFCCGWCHISLSPQLSLFVLKFKPLVLIWFHATRRPLGQETNEESDVWERPLGPKPSATEGLTTNGSSRTTCQTLPSSSYFNKSQSSQGHLFFLATKSSETDPNDEIQWKRVHKRLVCGCLCFRLT